MTSSITNDPALAPRASQLRAVALLIASRKRRSLYRDHGDQELFQAAEEKLQQIHDLEALGANDKVQWYADLYDLCNVIEENLLQIQARPHRWQESRDNACAPWEAILQRFRQLPGMPAPATSPLTDTTSLPKPSADATMPVPPGWYVHYKRKHRDYRGPLIDLLEAWRATGRAKPTVHDVLKEWASAPPPGIYNVDELRGFDCASGGQRGKRHVNCKALRQAMNRLIKDIDI